MKLADFEQNPKDLIGKKVLISSRYNKAVRTITRVTKTAFGFDDTSDLFNLRNGWIKGRDAWSLVTASLISDEEALRLTNEWQSDKLAYKQKEELTKSIQTLSNSQVNELYNFFKTIKP